MTASVASFLSQAQRKAAELPAALSGALLLAAVRLSEAKSQPIRPYQLLVDDGGALDLLTGDAPTTDGYAAPELRNGAVLPDDPRVLVYAAGALGYELITLRPPPPKGAAAVELQGPLAPVIRKALAERQQRYKTLADMARAIERIQRRPSRDEERLILAAVAASTPLPAAQKLAKIELERAAGPEGTPQPPPPPPEPQPVFTQVWDPLEPQPSSPAPPIEEDAVSAGEAVRVELQEERKARQQLGAAVDARLQSVAQLDTRLSLLEEQVRASVTPPLPASAALAREVKDLLDRRRFAEAERVLQDAQARNDALLSFRLGQALSATADGDGSRSSRAEAAFRRAAELDAGWAEPRVQLGALLLRRGRRGEALAQLRTALKLDPACPEALAILFAQRRPGALGFAASAAAGALAAAALVLALRPVRVAQPANPEAVKPTAVSSIAPVEAAPPRPAPAPPDPVPQPRASAPELPAPPPQSPQGIPAPDPVPKTRTAQERKPDPDARAARPARAESRSRQGKVASAARAEAEAEAGKGDKALRAFDTKAAEAAFSSALRLDPTLPSAHRGMGMVYVLLGKNAEAKAAYSRYLQLAPDAPDKEQIARLIAR